MYKYRSNIYFGDFVTEGVPSSAASHQHHFIYSIYLYLLRSMRYMSRSVSLNNAIWLPLSLSRVSGGSRVAQIKKNLAEKEMLSLLVSPLYKYKFPLHLFGPLASSGQPEFRNVTYSCVHVCATMSMCQQEINYWTDYYFLDKRRSVPNSPCVYRKRVYDPNTPMQRQNA